MDPIKEMHETLLANGIPHDYIVDLMSNHSITMYEDDIWRYGEKAKYLKNQIMYPSRDDCRFDAVWSFGSYGGSGPEVETYHELGCDEDGAPRLMLADEAIKIISDDWDKVKNEN